MSVPRRINDGNTTANTTKNAPRTTQSPVCCGAPVATSAGIIGPANTAAATAVGTDPTTPKRTPANTIGT